MKYRYLRKYYEKTTKKLRKNYGCTTMIYRSADYRSLQVTTGHYGHYRHYRFREKVTGFADGCFVKQVLQLMLSFIFSGPSVDIYQETSSHYQSLYDALRSSLDSVKAHSDSSFELYK